VRLIIFGPQGAGKGTQSARISEKYGIPTIATGDIFRWAVKGGTALGIKVREYVESGRLVPDDLTIDVVRDRLSAPDCADGFLLDGFPRNIEQAKALDEFLSAQSSALDAALAVEVPEEVSLRRIMGRRVCAECGRNYHVDAPPANDWTCDVCGGRVVERTDDLDEGAIRKRLELYREQTEPLKAYYEDRGLLREIDGTRSSDEVFARIVAVL
jgi:adenylate kinase